MDGGRTTPQKPISDNPQQEGTTALYLNNIRVKSNLLTATPALILHISGSQKNPGDPERGKGATRENQGKHKGSVGLGSLKPMQKTDADFTSSRIRLSCLLCPSEGCATASTSSSVLSVAGCVSPGTVTTSVTPRDRA